MQYPEIPWPSGAPINDKIVLATTGLIHHNVLTLSQHSALEHHVNVPETTKQHVENDG